MGNKIWERAYNPTSPTFGIGCAFFLPDGRMLLTGSSGEEVYVLTTTADGENACSMAEISLNVVPLAVNDSSYPLLMENPGVMEFIPPIEIGNVSVKDSLLCAKTVGLTELRTTQLEIFPNPAGKQLSVRVPPQAGPRFRCHILDALGRVLSPPMQTYSDEIQIELDGLAPGIYWVYLVSDTGVFSRKFVRR